MTSSWSEISIVAKIETAILIRHGPRTFSLEELLNVQIVPGIQMLEDDRRKDDPTTYYSPGIGCGRRCWPRAKHGTNNVGIVDAGRREHWQGCEEGDEA